MTSDLFKWSSMTADLKADKKKSPQKKKQKFSEPKPKGDIECWLEKARSVHADLDTGYVTRDEPVTFQYKEPVTFQYKEDLSSPYTEDVTSGSPYVTGEYKDVTASVDVTMWLKKVTMAAEVASSDLVLDEFVDEDVSAVFQSVLRDNLPYVKLDIDSPPVKETAILEERYDTLNEARSILSEWMSTKGDLETDSMFDEPSYRSNQPSYRSDQHSNQHSYHGNYDNPEEESVEETLQKLRALPIEKKVVDKIKKKKSSNPALSMALRQEKVKERRLAMEQERTNKLKSVAERKQVRAQADEILKEERIRKEREAKVEEDKIQGEMVALRKRLHSEQVERMVKYEREKEEQTCHHKEKLAEEYRKIVRETAEQEQSRKRILTTRHQLLKQLEDAEKKELKMRYQTLQQSFTVWRESTLDQRVQSNRASIHYTWQLQLCAWCKWKKYHRSKVSEREEKVKEVLFEENKRWRMAQLHYQHRNVYMCFKAWLAWIRTKTDKKREKLEELKRRLKMEECLATAVKIAQSTKDEQQKDEYNSDKYDKRKRKKYAPNFSNPPPEPQNSQVLSVENVQRLNEECVMRPNFGNTSEKKKPLRKDGHSQSSRSEDIKPRSDATKNREDTLPAHYPEPLPPSSNPWDTQPSRGVPQARPGVPQYPSLAPTTDRSTLSQKKVPAALKGMEERAAQRKQRQIEIEKRKEQKKEEEAERIREEQRQKDEEEKEKKQQEKERKLKEAEEAAALESQRVANIARHKEHMALALQHYHRRLLINYGLKPLKAMLANIAADNKRAEQFRDEKCTTSYFRLWKEWVREHDVEKEHKADTHYNTLVLKKSVRSWRRVMSVQVTFNTLAARHYKRVYRIRVIRAWSCAVKESKVRREGLVIAADSMLYRATIKHHFSSWVRLVPILKREKERAGRKDALRSKVAMLLPDYVPVSEDL